MFLWMALSISKISKTKVRLCKNLYICVCIFLLVYGVRVQYILKYRNVSAICPLFFFRSFLWPCSYKDVPRDMNLVNITTIQIALLYALQVKWTMVSKLHRLSYYLQHSTFYFLRRTM